MGDPVPPEREEQPSAISRLFRWAESAAKRTQDALDERHERRRTRDSDQIEGIDASFHEWHPEPADPDAASMDRTQLVRELDAITKQMVEIAVREAEEVSSFALTPNSANKKSLSVSDRGV
jgi:hypothetical protein